MNFAILYIVFLILSNTYRLWRVRRTSTRKKKRGNISGSLIYPVMFGLYLLIMVVAVGEYFIVGRKINWIISGIGFFMYTIVIPIRERAINSLGEYMAEHIEIKVNHKLIKKGPYKYMRHPLLLCLLIEMIGITLIPNSYYSFIMVWIIYFPTIILRMYLEEKALIQKFGQEYLNYKEEVYGMLPLKRVKKD